VGTWQPTGAHGENTSRPSPTWRLARFNAFMGDIAEIVLRRWIACPRVSWMMLRHGLGTYYRVAPRAHLTAQDQDPNACAASGQLVMARQWLHFRGVTKDERGVRQPRPTLSRAGTLAGPGILPLVTVSITVARESCGIGGRRRSQHCILTVCAGLPRGAVLAVRESR